MITLPPLSLAERTRLFNGHWSVRNCTTRYLRGLLEFNICALTTFEGHSLCVEVVMPGGPFMPDRTFRECTMCALSDDRAEQWLERIAEGLNRQYRTAFGLKGGMLIEGYK